MRYTQRGHLSGLVGENARADDILEHAIAVTAATQRLDAAILNIKKTEKWCKLQVHRVSLDRYIDGRGLDKAREEIELMIGITLPYTPRWINSETLAERYANGSIKHSTLVVTVISKQAVDAIIAKGLSFGGRQHEAEKFWEKGEGGMCMYCYS
jgi:hypothetical protein